MLLNFAFWLKAVSEGDRASPESFYWSELAEDCCDRRARNSSSRSTFHWQFPPYSRRRRLLCPLTTLNPCCSLKRWNPKLIRIRLHRRRWHLHQSRRLEDEEADVGSARQCDVRDKPPLLRERGLNLPNHHVAFQTAAENLCFALCGREP